MLKTSAILYSTQPVARHLFISCAISLTAMNSHRCFLYRNMCHIYITIVALLFLYLYATALESAPERYKKFNFKPQNYSTHLEIPVTGIDCCYNWCEGNPVCQGFIFDSRKRICNLFKDAFGELNTTGSVGQIIAIKSSIIGKILIVQSSNVTVCCIRANYRSEPLCTFTKLFFYIGNDSTQYRC